MGVLVIYILYSEVFLNLTEVFLTLTEVFPWLLLSCKANARVKLAKTGHGPHSSTLVATVLFGCYLCCSMYCLCVNVYCHRVTTQLQLINISYHISYSEVFLILAEVFPCFFLSCKANARVKLAKTGHGPHSSTLVVIVLFFCYLCCSMYCLCINVYCHRVTTQLQLINISYHISYSEVFLILSEIFPCFFLSYRANARVKLAKTGHGPHSSTLVVIVWVYVLFVCKCVLPPGDNPIAVNKYIISYHLISDVSFISSHWGGCDTAIILWFIFYSLYYFRRVRKIAKSDY